MAESTVTREKSKREQLDALEVSAFWTYQFNRIWCDLNFPPERINGIYPTLQLIAPELILPTTPKDQEQIDVKSGQPEPSGDAAEDNDQEDNAELKLIQELQDEEEEPKPPKPPVAVPPSYKDFPNDTDTPQQYLDTVDAAEAYLKAMPVKNYRDFQPEDGGRVFTIKRQRFFDPSLELLESLKNAIGPTLTAENEADAWDQYYKSAVEIFNEAGLQMTPTIRSDLNISFRQARQTAYARGLIAFGIQDGAVGAAFENLKDGHEIRTEHHLWDGVALAFDHPRFQEIVPPTDFGCVCKLRLVYSETELTPDDQIPTVKMGDTYKNYAQPESS
jgi:hypothetical protein